MDAGFGGSHFMDPVKNNLFICTIARRNQRGVGLCIDDNIRWLW